MKSLIAHNYLGIYGSLTLVKGIVFPTFLYIIRILNLSYSSVLTFLYIMSSLFFLRCIKKLINNHKILILIYIVLLFNPLSYSSDLFQRLYRNSLQHIELLLFLSFIINIICTEKTKIINYVFLGFTISLMFLTREDNMWTLLILLIVFIYKVYRKKNLKNIFVNFLPIFILIICLNIISYINYQYYGIYSYNELNQSEFKQFYVKVLKIKSENKINKVAINKSDLILLVNNVDRMKITTKDIEKFYEKCKDSNGEINNGNMIWYLRNYIYRKYQFKNAKEANKFFYEINKEIEKKIKEGKIKTEFVIPNLYINNPTINEIKEIPKLLIDAIIYTSSYQNIKSFDRNSMYQIENINYDDNIRSYYIIYNDYHYTENIIKKNVLIFEIIRIIYKYFTIILSFFSVIIFFKNIKIKDKLNLITIIIMLCYFIILLGIVYTEATAFHAIRYFYLGNIYILQNIFIILNLWRLYGNRCNNFNALFK